MNRSRHPHLLAVPILGERGGGVGQVSQLLWRTLRDEWGSRARVVTLLRNGHERPDAADKFRFGMEIAGRQIFDRPEWILFSHLGLARVARYLPGRLETPYAVFLHGIECWAPLPEEDLAILRRASLRVANSNYTAQRTLGANPGIGEIEVCPLALPDTPEIARSPSAGENRRTPSLLVVGRLSSTERYKGHEELIRAWPAVARQVPGARLVIVGDGDDAPRLRSLGTELARDSVEFTGFLPRVDLERRYSEAMAFAMPSRGEGFGLVYLEAMAAGLPCVGSIRDAASEVIANGETGVLVDPDNPDAMGRAIVDLLRNPAGARQMGEAGRLRLASHFSYEQFRERMTGLLHRAFAPAAAGRSR
jgi:phosphatidylinositol alpha-1,6-mannosyltransferase